MKERFVILRGIQYGSRFFTTYIEGEGATKLKDGTVAYEVMGYADTVQEAQIFLYGRAYHIKKMS